MSHTLVAELQRNAVASTFHLRVFAAQHLELGVNAPSLRAVIADRGGRVIDSRLDREAEVPELVARTFETQWMHLFYADALERFAGNEAVAAHVRRNGFWYPPATGSDDPEAAAVLDALFEPICRDFARVASEVPAFPEEGLTVHGVVGRLPDVFLREVEDALDELAEHGVLERDGDCYRRAADGPDPLAFAERWAWSGATRREESLR
jgi:hypothetical protein